MNGAKFIDEVKRRLAREGREKVTDREIADRLGITVHSLRNWRGRRVVSVQQMAGVLFKSRAKAMKLAEWQAIRPIVEFFKLVPADSRHRARTEIFSVLQDGGTDYPYLRGLRQELEKSRGIYIFYDSRGRAIYAGKARRQKLWHEINSAYNRDRSVQQILRVKHPGRGHRFRTSEEKQRQIRRRTVPLHVHHKSDADQAAARPRGRRKLMNTPTSRRRCRISCTCRCAPA